MTDGLGLTLKLWSSPKEPETIPRAHLRKCALLTAPALEAAGIVLSTLLPQAFDSLLSSISRDFPKQKQLW